MPWEKSVMSIREKLVKEILDSGLNAITVTLCDPKTFEHEAFEAAKRWNLTL